MTDFSLSKLRAFHAQLRQLKEAKIQMHFVGSEALAVELNADDSKSFNDALTKIEAIAALSWETDRTIASTIAEHPDVPESYRKTLQSWLLTDGRPDAFEGLTNVATQRVVRRNSLRVASIAPFTWLLIGSGALWIVFGTFIPKLVRVVDQVYSPRPPLLAALEPFSRASGSILSIGVFFLGCALFGLCFYFSSKFQNRTSHSTTSTNNHGLLAARLAEDIPHEATRDQAAQIVAQRLLEFAGDSKPAQNLPPIIQWSIADLHGTAPHKTTATLNYAQRLSSAAALYRAITEQRSRGDNVSYRLVPIVLVGGVFVCCVALTLFAPFAELIQVLVLPTGDQHE